MRKTFRKRFDRTKPFVLSVQRIIRGKFYDLDYARKVWRDFGVWLID